MIILSELALILLSFLHTYYPVMFFIFFHLFLVLGNWFLAFIIIKAKYLQNLECWQNCSWLKYVLLLLTILLFGFYISNYISFIFTLSENTPRTIVILALNFFVSFFNLVHFCVWFYNGITFIFPFQLNRLQFSYNFFFRNARHLNEYNKSESFFSE